MPLKEDAALRLPSSMPRRVGKLGNSLFEMVWSSILGEVGCPACLVPLNRRKMVREEARSLMLGAALEG